MELSAMTSQAIVAKVFSCSLGQIYRIADAIAGEMNLSITIIDNNLQMHFLFLYTGRI
jgi:hypothetical protein